MVTEQTNKAWLGDAINVMLEVIDENEEEELKGIDLFEG